MRVRSLRQAGSCFPSSSTSFSVVTKENVTRLDAWVRSSRFLSLDGETRGNLGRPPPALQTHDGAGAVQLEPVAAGVSDIVVDGVVELDRAHGAGDDGARVGAGEQT